MMFLGSVPWSTPIPYPTYPTYHECFMIQLIFLDVCLIFDFAHSSYNKIRLWHESYKAHIKPMQWCVMIWLMYHWCPHPTPWPWPPSWLWGPPIWLQDTHHEFIMHQVVFFGWLFVFLCPAIGAFSSYNKEKFRQLTDAPVWPFFQLNSSFLEFLRYRYRPIDGSTDGPADLLFFLSLSELL